MINQKMVCKLVWFLFPPREACVKPHRGTQQDAEETLKNDII
jgi:hypothetical protein